MGVRLMIEVLDHYHGPPRSKLWLLAFAESARDSTRRGWARRYKLAHRADVSGSRASHIATALIAAALAPLSCGAHSSAIMAPATCTIRALAITIRT